MKKRAVNYIKRLEKIAHTAAREYKECRIAPFEIEKEETRYKKERYIKRSWALWGAIQALSIAEIINEEEQKKYENAVYTLDEIAFEEEN